MKNYDDPTYAENCALTVELLTKHPGYIKLIKKRYLTDFVLEDAIRYEPEVFKYIVDPSLYLINVALEIDGSNLKYIPESRINTLPLESLILALDSNPEYAMQYISKMKLDETTKINVFFTDPIGAIENNIEVPPECILQAMVNTPNLIRYIDNPTEEMRCIALRSDPNIALYFDKLSEKEMDIIDELYPHLREMLPNYYRRTKLEENNNGTTTEE